MKAGVARGAAVLAALALPAAACAIFLKVHWFEASELDAKPFPLRGVDLPPPLPRGGIEYYGKVRLDVYVATDGTAHRVDVVQGSVPASLAAEAVRAFSQVGWEPGRKWGVRVNSVKVVEVDFEPAPDALGASLSRPNP